MMVIIFEINVVYFYVWLRNIVCVVINLSIMCGLIVCPIMYK